MRKQSASVRSVWPLIVAELACGGIGTGSSDTARVDIATVAGTGHTGFQDGPGDVAEFDDPAGIAVDLSGNIYVVDAENYRIRRIDAYGNVSTLAGNGVAGCTNGSGGDAAFDRPVAITVDTAGNVYVADDGCARISRIDPSGNVSPIAGNGTHERVDGPGGPDGIASFEEPAGIAVDQNGNVYVLDWYRIRMIDPSNNVTTLTWPDEDKYPPANSVAVDSRGILYFTSGEQVVTLTGETARVLVSSDYPQPTGGFCVTGMHMPFPTAVAVDQSDNVYFLDGDVRRISTTGAITKLVAFDGTKVSDAFQTPVAIAARTDGAVYVADTRENKIRVIDVH